MLWLSTRKTEETYWVCNNSLGLRRCFWLLLVSGPVAPPLSFLSSVILGPEGFYGLAHYSVRPRLWRGPVVPLSLHLALQPLPFIPRPTPLLHPDTQTVSVPVAVLHSTINSLIAVLFRLLGQVLYFQKEPAPAADLSICRNRAIIHKSHYWV